MDYSADAVKDLGVEYRKSIATFSKYWVTFIESLKNLSANLDFYALQTPHPLIKRVVQATSTAVAVLFRFALNAEHSIRCPPY